MRKKNIRKYKGIFLDVDGTLIDSEQTSHKAKVSDKVKNSIINANRKVSVGVASGRPLERITFIFDELGLKKPCIINGGAQIVDPITYKILWEKTILPKDIKIIINILRNAHNEILVVDDNKEKLFRKNLKYKKPLSFCIPTIEEFKADNIINQLSDQKTLALTKILAYKKGCVSLQITHIQATKKHAVIKAREIQKMSYQDTIGVGDGYNDLPLFVACGFKVAIGNAIPDLKKAADYIAPSIYEDGVAHIIEKFIL